MWGASDLLNRDATLWINAGLNPQQHASKYGVQRSAAQKLTRTLFYTPNPIFQAAVTLVASLLIDDTLSYAEHSDPTVRKVVEEFWQTNAFGEYMTQRAVIEYLLDGELAAVWNRDTPADLTARIGALDVAENLTVTGSTSRGLVAADMVERLTVNKGQPNEQSWTAEQCVWMAHNALHNDVRGWPPTLGAAMAAVGFISLVNSRLRANDLLSRLLAVYKAFLDPNGLDPGGNPDGGLSGWLNKARAFKQVPEDGAVVPLVVKPGYSVTEDVGGKNVTTKYDGVSESLEFPNPSPGAGDAASDIRILMRLVGTCLGLPEHWLGEGGNATRTTADAMTLPSVKIIRRHQAFLRGFMDRCIRTELERRFGPERLYTVYVMEQSADGLTQKRKRKRVPARLIEIGWILPKVSEHTLDELIRLAEAAEKHGWASSQTLSAGFGFDTAVEAEQMAAVGRGFGNSTSATPPAKGGEPNAPTDAPPAGEPSTAPEPAP